MIRKISLEYPLLFFNDGEELNTDDYCFKLAGFSNYFMKHMLVISQPETINWLRKSKPVRLWLMKKKNLSDEIQRHIKEWEHTYRYDLSLDFDNCFKQSTPHKSVNVVNSWDVEDPIKFKYLTIESGVTESQTYKKVKQEASGVVKIYATIEMVAMNKVISSMESNSLVTVKDISYSLLYCIHNY